MADNYYAFNRTLPAGFRLGRAFEDLENAYNRLQAERATFIQMCDGGNTSSAANFATPVTAYGFADTTEAKAAFDELDSLWTALSGSAAAITQALARFRN